MGEIIEIPTWSAKMFDAPTREALRALADRDNAEDHAPWGLVMELSVHEHVGQGYRQVVVNTSTQVSPFGWSPKLNMNAIFRTDSMSSKWCGIAGGAYLRVLDDLQFYSFINNIPKRFPAFAPPGVDLFLWDFEIMIFPGAVALARKEPLPRWDEGLKEVRRALTENLLVFLDEDESAHGRLAGVANVKCALEETLSRPPIEDDEVVCAPLAGLHLAPAAR